MAGSAQAKRYAQAVFRIAQEGNRFDEWLADLQTLAGLDRNDAFLDALETPNLTSEQKNELLRSRYPTLKPLAINLVNLLIERRRVAMLPGILAEFQRLLDEQRGIERAEVTTAVELTEEDKANFESRLSTLTGNKVQVTARVDASIIGGMVARFGGKLLDGSTRSRLDALKKEISHAPR